MSALPSRTERTLLGPAVTLTALTGLVALGVSSALAGGEGLRSAGLAIVLVLGFLVVGQLPVSQVARGRRRLGSALLVVLFTTRVLLLLVAFRLFYVSETVDRELLGLTVIACATAWTAGTVWSALRWRPMVVEPEDREPETSH